MDKGLLFDVQDSKKLRVIIDTDAACEADDPFAIVHALLSPKLMVVGITAEHFNCAGSVERSYAEIETILGAMELDVPYFLGEQGAVDTLDGKYESEAVDFIINEALSEDEHPLYILCQGAITNVAAAFRKRPDIISRVNIIWIGTHGEQTEAPFREFNAGNDIVAANEVLASGAKLTVVPSNVYGTITIGIAELQANVLPHGAIGRHLFEQLVRYNATDEAWWTKGESWSLGDSPAVAIALNPDCGHYKTIVAPVVKEDTSSSFGYGDLVDLSMTGAKRPMITLYTDVDSRYILGDMMAKIQLFAQR